MRHIDSPELFGDGVGAGTSGDFTCQICGTTYNEGADAAGDYMHRESVTHTTFAGLDVGDCCFERIEMEVEARMTFILRWFRAIVETRRSDVARDARVLDDIAMERPYRDAR